MLTVEITSPFWNNSGHNEVKQKEVQEEHLSSESREYIGMHVKHTGHSRTPFHTEVYMAQVVPYACTFK
jgi:hypothetical protein